MQSERPSSVVAGARTADVDDDGRIVLAVPRHPKHVERQGSIVIAVPERAPSFVRTDDRIKQVFATA